jgi:hypothetical protein
MPVHNHVLPGLSTYNYNTLKNYVVYLNDLMTSRFEMLPYNPTDQNYQFIADIVRIRTDEFNFFNFDWSSVTKYMLENEINDLRYTLEFINIKLQFNRFDPLPESLINNNEIEDYSSVVHRLSLLQEDPTSPSRPYTPPSGPTRWVDTSPYGGPSSPTSRPYTGRYTGPTSHGGYRKRKSRKSKKSKKSKKSRKSRK